MIPKTKLQKHVVSLSEKVPALTEKQISWAERSLFGGYFVRIRNRNFCLECGHKWKPEMSLLGEQIVKPNCPGCGTKKLIGINHWRSRASVYAYWAIIDVIEGYQLVRMIFTGKHMSRKHRPTYTHQEVIQHWIRPDGKLTTMTANSPGFMFDSWTPGSDLEVRGKSYRQEQMANIIPNMICPGRKTLPIIRRNGYKGPLYNEAPHQFFVTLLTNPRAETLLKAGQVALFKSIVGNYEYTVKRIEMFWPSICIAIRNNYIITEATHWIDYLKMLLRFGKDIRNSVYVCPADLKAEHDRYVEKVRQANRKERLEELRGQIAVENPEYVINKGKFFDLHIQANGFDIIPLKSVYEFFDESEKLRHCIFASEYYKREDSLLLSARKDGETVATVEVDLNRLEVSQARGRFNAPTEYNEAIIEAMQQNMPRIASKMNTH